MDECRSGPVAVAERSSLPADIAWEAGHTQLDLALRRVAEEAGAVDPEAAVARFGSAW